MDQRMTDMKHKLITVLPTPAKAMKPGDLFRGSDRIFQIADIEKDGEVFVVTYYTGTSTFINSFILSPNDTLDKIIDKEEDTTDKNVLVLKKGDIKALADELLNIDRALNTIIRIAADNGVDPFQQD